MRSTLAARRAGTTRCR